jgi:hypothetical protein
MLMNGKQSFLSKANPEYQEIITLVMSDIESVNENLHGSIKWGNYTYALSGDFHHWICAVAITKKSVNLIFHYGGLLDDKKGILIAGTSKFLRKIEFQNKEDIDRETVKEFVIKAIDKLDYFKKNWKEINKTK